VGVQVRERSERKIFFDLPTFGLPWGDIKQDITVFIAAIMTYLNAYACLHQMMMTVACVTIVTMARLKLRKDATFDL